MKILIIGDIMGRPGRRSVTQWLPQLREQYGPDFVVANAENASGGVGATPEAIETLRKAGVDAFTMGNHTWRKKALFPILDATPTHASTDQPPVLRPSNFAEGVPGRGACVIKLPDGRTVGLINLIGRVYMEPSSCPFIRANEEIEWLKKETSIILVDMHGEASSEKVAMGWHLDGRVSAVVGTHTHIQTADEWILPQGTAYITDIGMCGPMHSVIGMDKDIVLNKFITGMPARFNVAKGPVQFNAVYIELDDQDGTAQHIERIRCREEDN
jgi:metallophosphoesterase (TIGR00282 family)